MFVKKIGGHGSDVGKPVVVDGTENFDGALGDVIRSAARVQEIFEVAPDGRLEPGEGSASRHGRFGFDLGLVVQEPVQERNRKGALES